MSEHGFARRGAKAPEYNVWVSMNARCYTRSDTNYRYYGARGIRVAPEWRGKGGFRRFMEHMGPRPFPGASIDRIDSNGNYAPGNLRWRSQREQMRNMRRNKRVSFNGESLTIGEWAERAGMSEKTLRTRLEKGLGMEEALTRPVGRWAK